MRRKIKTLPLRLLFLAGTLLLTQCGKKDTADKTKLKIGVVLSLTGNGAVTGDYTLKGIQLAVNEQNAKGGLLNRQIELDIQDSKGVAATGLDIITGMFSGSDKPFMVCSNTSDVSLAIKTETEKNKAILVASAATDKLMEGGSYIIRNYIESGQISNDVLKYMNESLHINSLGVFYANNEFGNSVNNKIAEKAGDHDIALPFDAHYDDKNLDYEAVISAENINAVPAIYVIGLGNSLGVFIKQLRAAGYAGIIIADPLFNNPGTIAAAGTAASGVQFLDFDFHKDSATPVVKTFVDSYTATFHTAPENLGAITYDALKILFAGIEKSKSLDYKQIPKPTEDKKYTGVTGTIWVKDGNIIYPTAFKTQP